MRVLLLLQPHLLEPGLHLARELAARTELHLLLEVAPASRGPLFDGPLQALGDGIIPADPILAPLFPLGVRDHWLSAASFHLMAFGHRRTLDPRTAIGVRQAVRFISRLSPDVVHLDDVSLRLALSGPSMPTVDLLAIHDPLPHSGEREWRGQLARRLLLPRSKRILLHNNALRDAFIDRYGLSRDAVQVVHLGAYELYRNWATGIGRSSEPLLLFFGRLSPYKGLEDLYAALPSISEQIPGLHVVVAGRPEYGYTPPAPPPLAHGGRVEMTSGHIPIAHLANLLERAWVVACPYRDATQSGVVLTAYAFDVPVVATSVGGLPEYVEDGRTGFLVPPGDRDALSAALLAVISDRVLRERLSRGVAEFRAGTLRWDRAAERILSIYPASMASSA